MKVAVLPFNAAAGTSPALGRQFANFACDIARANTGGEINAVSYLTDIQEEGELRAVFANVSEGLTDRAWITEMFTKAQVDMVVDGLLKIEGEEFDLTVRFFEAEVDEPVQTEVWKFNFGGLFEHLDKLIALFTEKTGLPNQRGGTKIGFGTADPGAFARFLEGYDGLLYLQQAGARATRTFVPKAVIELLLEALRADNNFVAPADTLTQFCRTCAGFRLGTFEMLVAAIEELKQIVPEDFKPIFALGEIHAGVGQHAEAADCFERCIEMAPDQGWIYSQLALSQIAMGMPVNAERNLRKAIELERAEKPSMDILANVLIQTGRVHEVPALWKSLVDANQDNVAARGKYAISLIQAGRVDEGEREFEAALGLDNSLVIKRYYAPYLADKGDIDRAMDFYEDCLDQAPNDIDTLQEYAKTLQKAGREFEVPRVLQDILKSNPDPDTAAETLAWLIELEQPKRVENVMEAHRKMDAGEFETAVKELRPMRNWLADYWKLWALLASSLNGLNAYGEAEEAARRLLQLYPGCEPGYGELATALNGQGKHEEAYEIMKYAASNMPQSLPVHINLALSAKRAGHDGEAKTLARQIREAVGPNPDLEPILVEIEA